MSSDPEQTPTKPEPEDDDAPEASSPPCYAREFSDPKAGPGNAETPAAANPVDELTPEEQMERFERELKESDWGHQPC